MPTTKLHALRGVCVDGIDYSAGPEITCEDGLAAELVASGKAEAADAATRKRVRITKSTWTDAPPEPQAQRSAGWIGRR
jgi:hypothetical protein